MTGVRRAGGTTTKTATGASEVRVVTTGMAAAGSVILRCAGRHHRRARRITMRPRDRRNIVRSHTTVRRHTTTADRRAAIAGTSRAHRSTVTVTNHQEPAKLALSFC